ncbi:MAG: hypothetical protein FRX49_02607 [Trebouxia sp. A1-2]|nr:MAG: hypothetical protein FRX49_02607 [Trebouxia sp. A1-2]
MDPTLPMPGGPPGVGLQLRGASAGVLLPEMHNERQYTAQQLPQLELAELTHQRAELLTQPQTSEEPLSLRLPAAVQLPVQKQCASPMGNSRRKGCRASPGARAVGHQQLTFTSDEPGTEATLQEPADNIAETAWNAVMSSFINQSVALSVLKTQLGNTLAWLDATAPRPGKKQISQLAFSGLCKKKQRAVDRDHRKR